VGGSGPYAVRGRAAASTLRYARVGARRGGASEVRAASRRLSARLLIIQNG
jgi:hypothetical protein